MVTKPFLRLLQFGKDVVNFLLNITGHFNIAAKYKYDRILHHSFILTSSPIIYTILLSTPAQREKKKEKKKKIKKVKKSEYKMKKSEEKKRNVRKQAEKKKRKSTISDCIKRVFVKPKH